MGELTDLILERLDDEEVSARGMFGGVGFFKQGLMFALSAWEELYLKVDDHNEARFAALELGPFEYEKSDGARSVMSYRQAPPEALDSSAVMQEWAASAFEAACRADAAKPPSRRKRT